jgi:NitT/TauT family transport system permease protein
MRDATTRQRGTIRYRAALDLCYPAFAIALTLAGWEALTRLKVTPAYALPAPADVFVVLIQQWRVLLINAASTTAAILAGFLLSVVVGIALAVLISSSRVIAKSIYPLLVGSQAIPKLALAPLFVVWFGFGMLPKILMTFLIAVFPIVVSTVQGISSVETELEFLARSMGLGSYRTFRMIRLYRALPAIFSGLKVAITLAVVGAVVGEFIGSDQGLGTLLLRAIGVVNTPLLFAGLIVLTILAVVLFALIELVERLAIPWHVSQRSKSR